LKSAKRHANYFRIRSVTRLVKSPNQLRAKTL
jgi:hypothetical protein